MRKDVVVRPFPTCHVVPSQGYLVVSKRKKLKQEYVGAGREVIIDAKNKGIEINDVTEVSPSVSIVMSARVCYRCSLRMFGICCCIFWD